ncbi:MAG: nickel ABC transporter permease subunit NikB, partial [Selenomonadaceae bacterium]|nr:nickel ABC transporter permease subunit NikB [Selenomonadaceae bacterium]
MSRYVMSRLLQLIPILIGITFLTFALMQLTNDDAVDVLYQQSGSVSDEVKAVKRAELGLDQPFIIQYGQ